MKVFKDWIDQSLSLLVFKFNIFLVSSFNIGSRVSEYKQLIINGNATKNKNGEIMKLDTNLS